MGFVTFGMATLKKALVYHIVKCVKLKEKCDLKKVTFWFRIMKFFHQNTHCKNKNTLLYIWLFSTAIDATANLPSLYNSKLLFLTQQQNCF